MQTLLRETDFSKSLEKFPVVYDRNPHEVGHNSMCSFFLLIELSLIICVHFIVDLDYNIHFRHLLN